MKTHSRFFRPASWLAAWLYCRNTIYPRGSLYGNWFPTAAARGCRCGGDSPAEDNERVNVAMSQDPDAQSG